MVESAQPPSAPSADDLRAIVDDPLGLEEHEHPHVVVTRLAHQAFVRVARRLQEENRLELLLPHATPEQLTSLLDIDAWENERLHLERARSWILLIADIYVRGDKPRGALVDLLYRMDPEMWTLALAPGTYVVDLDPDDANSREMAIESIAHLRTWETPDGLMLVGVPDDDMGQMVLATLDLVYADDIVEGRKLAKSIQTALPAEIEEDLLRFRSGRLADLGFVGWEEAMRLFRPLDSGAVAKAEPKNFAYLPEEMDTGGVLASLGGPEMLRRVLDRLSDPEHGLRTREFMLLVNEVMAAQRFPPGNDQLQERAIDQTQSTITLGLELLQKEVPEHPDPEAFLAGRIAAVGLRDLFRVGYRALEKLRDAATALHRGSRVSLSQPGSLLDRPWGPAIAAFSRWYPELPLQGTSSRTRPIRGLRDVALAAAWVAEAGALARLAFDPLGYAIDPVWITRVDEPERLVLGDLVRTSIVHAHLPGSSGAMAPLTPPDVTWAHHNLISGGRLADAVRTDFSRRCDAVSAGPHATVLAKSLLTRLEVELAGVELIDGQADLTRTGGLLTIQQVGMWLKTRTGEPN